LNGSKLKGEFALVKLKGKEDNAWLLIKHRDKYAKETDITAKDKSVLSGKSLETIAKTSDNIYGQKKKNVSKPVAVSTPKKKTTVKKKIQLTGKKSAFPSSFSPMLATLVDKPFDDPGWIYEIKWDGYRAVGMVNKGKVELISRNNKSFNDKFYPIVAALKKWKHNAIVD
jgi:bifunctional non-homologous end joining protein LigD